MDLKVEKCKCLICIDNRGSLLVFAQMRMAPVEYIFVGSFYFLINSYIL